MTAASTRRTPHRWRRTAAAVLATAMGMALLPASGAWADEPEPRGTERICSGAPASEFEDTDGNVHEANIGCMADRGLTAGVGDGSEYAPDRPVRRDQMASFIARFLEDYTGEDLDAGDPGQFEDVAQDNVHRDNIGKLAAIDVVSGTSADTYAPEQEITRAQMAALIRRALSWLDDEDATSASAPEAAEASFFDDTEGSVHADDIDALAAEGIVAGFGDGEYGPEEPVRRDQMASFVMRGYDFAIEAELGEGPDAPPTEVAELLDPTQQAPLFPVAPGDEVDITFATDRSGEYTLEYRDPAPEGDGFLLFPVPGDDEPGPWTAFEGDDASGAVGPGTHEATVTLPDDEPNDGVRDLRLIFEYGSTTVTVTETAALIVADGVVINLTQEALEFSMQDAVDEAADGDDLLAIGAFDETVEIDGLTDLSLGAMPETELAGTIVATEADGLTLSELTITEYDAVAGGLGTGLISDDIGLAIEASEDVTLVDLTFLGDGGDDIAVRAGGDVTGEIRDSVFAGNDVGVLLLDGAAGLEIGEGNTFADNAAGIVIETSGASVSGSTFDTNETGIVVDGGVAEITDNAFDGHDVAIELAAPGAQVTDNVFGEGDAEHLCFDDEVYSTSVLLNNNTFDYAEDPEVRGDDPTCIGPPVADDDGDANGDDA